MKTSLPRTVSIISTFLIFSLAFGQSIELQQSNPSGIYAKGESVRVTAKFVDMQIDSLSFKIIQNDIHTIIDQTIAVDSDEIELLKESYAEPTSIIIEARADKKYVSLGLVIAPEEFTPGFERPKDFKRYWKNEIKNLRALKMDIQSIVVDSIESGYVCSDIEINCINKPARGYFAKPENAAAGSLPIVLNVHAAGVSGHWCLSQPQNALQYAKMGNGALCLDLNAHGMLNDQPIAYYRELERGELKNYWAIGLEDRESFYFRSMYLRLIRTLDFLTTQPEWDGKRILVIGESQGGGQALAAAGLDDRVTAAVATVPAMCDWGAPLDDRKGGWPNIFDYDGDKEKMRATLPYFDAALLLKNCKATLVTEIGFIDKTCPSASVYAAINQAKGEKIIFGVPYRGHHVDQKQFQQEWEKTVYQPKMDFITEYLQ